MYESILSVLHTCRSCPDPLSAGQDARSASGFRVQSSLGINLNRMFQVGNRVGTQTREVLCPSWQFARDSVGYCKQAGSCFLFFFVSGACHPILMSEV